MALFRVQPTRAELAIADTVSRYTEPELEKGAEALTWGTDDHVVCALAAARWLCARNRHRGADRAGRCEHR